MHNGYVRRMENYVAKLEHIRVAERAVGHKLAAGVEVHHVNGVRSDNRPCNLVVCPDAMYHRLLHKRTEALEACGHADWRKCRFCKTWDAPGNLFINASNVHHRACCATYYRTKRGYVNERTARNV